MSPVTNRLEKHNGLTLVVRDGWITVVLDRTGHAFEGPVDSHAEMMRFLRLVIPVLQQLGIAGA